jgi:hypothetical protein
MIDPPALPEAGKAVRCLPDPVPAHPLLDGLAEIGRGESSIVLAAALSAASATAAYTPEQVAAESTKANALFERFFDEGVARSPMTVIG